DGQGGEEDGRRRDTDQEAAAPHPRKGSGGPQTGYLGPEEPPPSQTMRVALAQIDPTVGDIDGNSAKVAEWIGRAREEGADLVIFPELCIPGYPAEDLYLKRHFLEANRRAVEELATGVEGITALVGFAEPIPGGGEADSPHAYNALAVLA